MDFKNLKADTLTIMAELVRREAAERDPAMTAALRRIEVVPDGRYGIGRPDVRLTIVLDEELDAAIDSSCELQSASIAMLANCATELVDTAERIFDDRDEMIEMLREVRSALSREISKGRRRGLPYRTVEIGLTPCEAGCNDVPTVTIAIEVIGPMLDTMRTELIVEGADDLAETFAYMSGAQLKLHAAREHLRRSGADVIIDAITLAALEDAGVAPAAAMADLRTSEFGVVDVATRHGLLVLAARDGVVSGNVPLGNGAHWVDGGLTFTNATGSSVADLIGTSLRQVLPHDFFVEEDVIESGFGFGGNLCLRVRPRHVALSLARPS